MAQHPTTHSIQTSRPVQRIISRTFLCLLIAGCHGNQDIGLQREESPQCEALPAKGENNMWYRLTDSDIVIVFVHGVLSDTRSAWTYENAAQEETKVFWPDLIATDTVFRDASIFLGGYKTTTDSGDYSIESAATELFSALKRPEQLICFPEQQARVIDKQHLLFVAHSTGGIVVRQILTEYEEDFRDKTVGLALFASPSTGSKFASDLEIVTTLTGHKQGKQLKWNSDFLDKLDKTFYNFVHKRRIRYLTGQEAIEHHLFASVWYCAFFKWLWGCERVVPENSGARYFADPHILPDTTHISIVKPHDASHPGYQFLSDFYRDRFKPLIIKRSYDNLANLQDQVEDLYCAYESRHAFPNKRNVVLRKADDLATQLMRITASELSLVGQIAQLEYASLCFVMAAQSEQNNDKIQSYAQKAESLLEQALSVVQTAEKQRTSRNFSRRDRDWLVASRVKDRILFNLANMRAILATSDDTKAQVCEVLQRINSAFFAEYPISGNPALKAYASGGGICD